MAKLKYSPMRPSQESLVSEILRIDPARFVMKFGATPAENIVQVSSCVIHSRFTWQHRSLNSVTSWPSSVTCHPR